MIYFDAQYIYKQIVLLELKYNNIVLSRSYRMDDLAEDTKSSNSAVSSTDDTNSDEIWEIIDKEDDGNVLSSKS